MNFHQNHRSHEITFIFTFIVSCRGLMYINLSKIINSSLFFFIIATHTGSRHEIFILHKFITMLTIYLNVWSIQSLNVHIVEINHKMYRMSIRSRGNVLVIVHIFLSYSVHYVIEHIENLILQYSIQIDISFCRFFVPSLSINLMFFF